MKKLILLILVCLLCCWLVAQISPRKRDSVIAVLQQTTDPATKIGLLNRLSLSLIGDSLALSDQFGLQQIMIAEESRNTQLICQAYLNNSQRYLYIGGSNENLGKALDFTKRGLAYAESVKDYNHMVLFYTRLAAIQRQQMNVEKAVEYNNKAIGLLGDVTDDSAKVVCYQGLGNTYMAKNDKLPALRSYLNALQVAEASRRDVLVAQCYNSLVDFYTSIEQFSQARDYAFRMLEISRNGPEKARILNDYNVIAGIYKAEKQFDLAMNYYEKIERLADSLGIDGWKMQNNVNMMNLYFSSNQLAKGAAFFNAHPEITNYIKGTGMGYHVDMAKATVMTEMKVFDSAAYFFKLAEPSVEARSSPINRYYFYHGYASFYKATGNNSKYLEYLLKANAIAENSHGLDMMQTTARELDSAYTRMGNMTQAAIYKSKYYQYKDSLAALSKEKDLVNLQIEDERKRQDRLAKEKQARMDRKHNLQLMGLSIGIFSFLCLLLMLGRFKVSETLIRILSFIALIFLFEFVILIADQQIHHWTHGEPIKVILIKVVIAAILLPLHHVFEHKMIHYLTTRNKLRLDAGRFWNGLKIKKIQQNTPHT